MELNLLDDFLIAVLISHPVYGEQFCREVLKIIFKREFQTLKITPQKLYPGKDTDLHGARLDVYLEEDVKTVYSGKYTGYTEDAKDDIKDISEIEIMEDEDISEIEIPDEATIIDLEPNQTKYDDPAKILPRRVRFYHAKIDTKALHSGEEYDELKKVVVVMFTPYDPLGYGLMRYTVKSKIKELPDADYEDGAETIFFYTKGKVCDVDEETKWLLRYMEHSTKEHAVTDALKKIHKIVENVKREEEVQLKFMKAFERRNMWINKGKLMGQELERENTERERRRADIAEGKLYEKEQEIEYWKNLALSTTT